MAIKRPRNLLALVAALCSLLLLQAQPAFAVTYQKYKHFASGFYLFSTVPSGSTTGVVSKQNIGNPVINFEWYKVARGSYFNIVNHGTGQCLDSNANKRVYTNPCGATNTYQQWSISYSHGVYDEYKNRATGLCLDGSGTTISVYTNPCATGNTYQWWDAA